ncbi:MAG: hypothetical protein AAF141_10100 [Pseudomonadota bacterium]
MALLLAVPLLASCDAEPADEATIRICPAHELEGVWQASQPGDENGSVVKLEIEGRCSGLDTELTGVVHTACGRTPCKWPKMPLNPVDGGFEGSVESFAALRSARLEQAGLLVRGTFISQFVSGDGRTERGEAMFEREPAR